jgi:hypothetical protein
LQPPTRSPESGWGGPRSRRPFRPRGRAARAACSRCVRG